MVVSECSIDTLSLLEVRGGAPIIVISARREEPVTGTAARRADREAVDGLRLPRYLSTGRAHRDLLAAPRTCGGADLRIDELGVG